MAGTSSGVADIRAISGGATGTGAGTGTTTATNAVQITIGAAAVNAITVRANPGTVGPNGGPVELIATVVSESGNGLVGIPVTFNADQGVLTAQTTSSDSNGEARTVLTTAQRTNVTATAGTKTSTAVIVDVRTAPGVSITCAPTSGTGTNCAAIQPGVGNTATVLFTVTKATGTSNLRDVTIAFGDGTSQSVGSLSGGATTLTHTYSGPSGSGPNAYTATAQAIDVNGETSSTSTTVVVLPRAPLNVTITAAKGTASSGQVPFTLTANVTGSTDVVEYSWEFDDGSTATTSGNVVQHFYAENSAIRTVKVTVKTSDGRTASGQTQINP
jgi:hypothetical protein